MHSPTRPVTELHTLRNKSLSARITSTSLLILLSGVQCPLFFAQTLCFMTPQKKKYRGARSSDLVGHSTMPLHLPTNFPLEGFGRHKHNAQGLHHVGKPSLQTGD